MNNNKMTNKRIAWIGSFATILLVASLAIALHGCTDESDAVSATEELLITVTDSSYRPADAPRSSETDYATRAIEDGYKTTFTEGDKIGFYSVKNKALVDKNLCLTMKNGVWTPPEGVKLLKNEADHFFVYFPYKESPGTVYPAKTAYGVFFDGWVRSWKPSTDQRTQANYSAQDLMLGTGTLEGRNLTVTLNHQMALVVIGLPTGVSAQTFSGFKPFQVGNEYRYLIPSEEETKIEGTYTNGTSTHEYTFNANISLGMYKKFGFAPVSMSYKIDLTGQTYKTYTLPFKESGTISGYFLKVDWGDGTVSKIADGTNLSTPITHDYGASATGEKTIIIYSSQGDYSQEQVPGFKPGLYRIGSNNNLKLKQLLTPLLNTGETSFISCFEACENLIGSIPEKLFANNPQVAKLGGCFFQTGLTGEIPPRLFANNKEVTDFVGCFNSCKGLTGSIPAGLFANNTEVTDFTGCFSNCSGLTGSIPAGLFANNTEVTSFEYCFGGCSDLTGSIPAELFANNPQVTSFFYCFRSCTKLTLNKNIFCNEDTDKTTRFAGKNVDFTQCFQNVGSDSSVSANAGTAPALWSYAGTFDTGMCYTNIGTVTNKADIPSAWQ